VERSTRLSILEHALTDVVERLQELAPSTDTEALRALARQYETEMAIWEEHPPDEATRVALLKRVLDLNVEVIRAGGPEPKVDADDAEDPDDDYPQGM
jgi:hypothetical protein